MNDRNAVRCALLLAIDYETSFVDSYSPGSTDPAVLRAKSRIVDFKRVLAKRYGEVPVDPFTNSKAVSIYSILADTETKTFDPLAFGPDTIKL